MRRQIIAAIVVIGAIVGLPAASQEPAPTLGAQQEQPQAAKPDQPSPGLPQATPQQPTIIYVQPPHKTEAEAEEDRRERREKSDLDQRLVDLTAELSAYTGGLYRATVALAIATALLVIATIGLVVFARLQARDTKALIAASKKAADAAELNARAAIGLQLPVIRINLDAPVALMAKGSRPVIIGGVPPIGQCRVQSLLVTNTGNSKAWPSEVGVGWTIARSLPETPSYSLITTIAPDTIWEPKAEPIKLGLGKYQIEITAEDHAHIKAGSATFWFYYYVAYEDFVPQRHSVGMCWRWKEAKGSYKWSRDHSAAAYNWRRQVQ